MATLTGQTITTSYEQLLSLPSGGLNGTSLVAITDGDSDTACALQVSTTKVMITGDGSTLYFYDEGGESINADSSGKLTIAAAAEIESNTAIFDLNASGAVTLNGVPVTITSTGDITLDSSTDIILDAAGNDFIFKDGGTSQLKINNSTAGDIDITLMVNSDDLVFNQYDDTEVMRITDTVRVGITEASPDVKLHLSDATSGVWAGLRLESTDKDGFTFIDFKGLDNADYLDNANGIRWLKGSDTVYMFAGQPYDDGVLTDDTFSIGSDHTEDNSWFYIHAGNIGVGVTDAGVDAKFHIEGTGDPSLVSLIKATALTDTDYAAFTVKGTGNSVENEIEIGVMYEASPTGGTNAPTGYIKLDPSDGASAYLWVDDSNIARISATRTHIGSTSGTVIGAQSSDERLKDISSDAFPYGLSQVNAMTPIKYQFKDDSENVDRLGFGAQTMKSIIPESVKDTKQCIDGYDVVEETETNKKGQTRVIKKTDKPKSSDENQLAMEYVQLIPVLVKAVQELSAKVAALEAA